MPELYVKYQDDKPIAYAYGEEEFVPFSEFAEPVFAVMKAFDLKYEENT